ncbi:hypothetical protein Tco_0010193, partial [Tanacetum coccineum]
DEAGPSPSLEISCFEVGLASRLREEALREQGASLPLSERPIEREAVNQLSGLGLLVSEGCFGKAYERLSFDGRSVAGGVNTRPLAGLLAKTDPPPTTLYGLVSEATEYSYLLCSVDSSAHSAYDSYPIASSCSLSAGVKDGSSSSSALLAASSQLSSKRWFARAIVRISSTMSTESSTRNHFFDILEKIKQFRVSKLMVVTVGSSPKCIKTLGSTIPRPALGCVKPRADTNKSVPLIPPNTEPPKGRPVPTSKIGRAASYGSSLPKPIKRDVKSYKDEVAGEPVAGLNPSQEELMLAGRLLPEMTLCRGNIGTFRLGHRSSYFAFLGTNYQASATAFLRAPSLISVALLVRAAIPSLVRMLPELVRQHQVSAGGSFIRHGYAHHIAV